MPQGYVVPVLHAHLPYVLSHGKWPHGSDWLCEATCETYIPLLNAIERIDREGKRAGLTIGLTPVLCEMLASPLFASEFEAYVAEKVRAAKNDRRVFKKEGRVEQARQADRWRTFYETRLREFVDVYRKDLLAAFGKLQEQGQIEIVVSAATHAYLPLLDLDTSVSAQIRQGVETYRRRFHREPAGMWLPECAYRPAGVAKTGSRTRRGLESLLAESGLKYFFLEGCHVQQKQPTHGYGLEVGPQPGAAHRGVPSRHYEAVAGAILEKPTRLPPEEEWREARDFIYGIHTIGSPGTGECAVFSRDTDTCLQVWSGQWGYPGDPAYLEFHKKHSPGGLRYWSVTDHEGALGMKRLYDPQSASARVAVHAAHFKGVIEGKLGRYLNETGEPGVLTLLFDAELFGHWWFEGIDWLYALLSLFAGEASDLGQNCAKIERASVVLQSIAPLSAVSLPEGSWGEGGLHFTWQNKETAWTWEHIHGAERSMAEAVAKGPVENTGGSLETTGQDVTGTRILKQMARELFLLESSDWQFLITTGSAADYGKSRFLGHYNAFEELRAVYESYVKGRSLTRADEDTLRLLEEQDAVFDNVKPEWFRERTEDGL